MSRDSGPRDPRQALGRSPGDALFSEICLIGWNLEGSAGFQPALGRQDGGAQPAVPPCMLVSLLEVRRCRPRQ
jgi:hypothetical protein